MTRKNIGVLARAANMGVAVFAATTLGIHQPKHLKLPQGRKDSRLKELAWMHACMYPVSGNRCTKRSYSETEWVDLLTQIIGASTDLEGIRNKWAAFRKDSNRFPEVFMAMDYFVSEALRRRSNKSPYQPASGEHRPHHPPPSDHSSKRKRSSKCFFDDD